MHVAVGGCTYHLDGGISEVDELGEDLAIFAGSVKLGCIPEGEDGANELGEALRPCSVGIGFALWRTNVSGLACTREVAVGGTRCVRDGTRYRRGGVIGCGW